MGGRDWSPWQHVAEQWPGVIVHRARLQEGRGWWCAAQQVIIVDDRLGRVASRCALSHELGHAELGHRSCDGYADAARATLRMERDAEAWAARQMIGVDQLADALAWAHDRAQAAAELDVVQDLLDVRLARLHPTEWHHLRHRLARLEEAA